MALNPFFLQGNSSEQRLVQDLINEQLRMYGVEVVYIPRKFVNKKTIIQEVQTSRFDDNFSIEAYVNTYEGYSGAGDILSKFGMSLRDELLITISKERFEDFIAPFLGGLDDGTGEGEIILSTRPREGDLVYFPLGQRIFEVKFVEHEKPFYQLGKNYVYELKCELFEYEDEVIDTSIQEIDTQIRQEGYITTLRLVGVGRTATATAALGTGYIRQIFLNNDGYGYRSTPIVSISTSPTSSQNPFNNATAVAITRNKGGIFSVERILLTNAGIGYTVPPIITISGGGGAGAAATCSIETTNSGVVRFNISDGGVGYGTVPNVTLTGGLSGTGTTAVGIASIGAIGSDVGVKAIYIANPGSGYIGIPTVTIANPEILTGTGTYLFNEIVRGSRSQTRARVKNWDEYNKILKISNVGIGETQSAFFPGETIIGTESGALYTVQEYEQMDIYDKYSQNDEIEEEADLIIDFSESNPFGNY
jgi:preprotein translocase subunit Sss1